MKTFSTQDIGPAVARNLREFAAADTALADAATALTARVATLENLGTKGYAQVTSNQTGITTMTDLTGLSVTWTAVAGRRYRVSFKVLIFSTVANDDANVWIRNGSSTKLNAYGVRAVSTTHGIAVTGSHVLAGLSAGSQTVKLSLERAAGSGSLGLAAASTHPSFILVEDIGI